MNIGREGIALIKKWEGLQLEPYTCPAGHATIGYGHKIHAGPVTENDKKYWSGFTEAKAIELLFEDLKGTIRWANRAISARLNQNQFDAVVCWIFNVGIGAAGSSETFRALNSEQYELFSDKLLQWNKIKNPDGVRVVSAGLSARRRDERALFNKAVQ